MTEATISVVDSKALLSLFGTRDQHLRKIRDALSVDISARDDQIRIQGPDTAVARATEVLEQLKSIVHRQGSLEPDEVTRVLSDVTGEVPAPAQPAAIEVLNAGRKVVPRTPGQARYVRAIAEHDIVLCIGPAGTGKTYLAVAMAVAALKQERIRKIVLVRPAVEAGESLGYLPGDLQAKINPYLRPLLDALREMMDYDQIRRYTDQDLIEVIPLAYMRGRTLNEAFIILDEAQNTTVSQMKMFLTRMGRGSKIVVSGDVTQIDLPPHATSGLIDAMRRLRRVKGLTQVTLTDADIVRHRLVQDIVRAYEEGAKRRRPTA
ncbi:MAG: PhoH family protein [Planctomycetia bacterium]|nr:PhoH family protein [Planctomycetia bacterium]